jgi:hypothetical protein
LSFTFMVFVFSKYSPSSTNFTTLHEEKINTETQVKMNTNV